jgi:hypothetical protein
MEDLVGLKAQLRRGLELSRGWMLGMINPRTRRLYYEHQPELGRVHQHSPIRDIGTASDLGVLQSYFGDRAYEPAIRATLEHYTPMLVRERRFEQEGPLTAGGLGHTETEAELGDRPMPW